MSVNNKLVKPDCRFFNNIDISGSILIKSSKDKYGAKIIEKEINFYRYILKNNINFSIPCIYSLDNNSIHMYYLKEYIPLYKYLDNTNDLNIISQVKDKLNILHSSSQIKLDKEIFRKQLLSETTIKINKRINIIKHRLEQYNYINFVNRIKIKTFNEYIEILEIYINNWIEQQDQFIFNIIHGDPNLSNILINPVSKDIVFIDPRGYFGEYLLYGPSIYDNIKILFGLSGYDNFNFSKTIDFIITDNNIDIKINPITDTYFKQKQIETILMVSIWLGLPQYLENDTNKMIISYFYSMYLAEKYFLYT